MPHVPMPATEENDHAGNNRRRSDAGCDYDNRGCRKKIPNAARACGTRLRRNWGAHSLVEMCGVAVCERLPENLEIGNGSFEIAATLTA